MAVEGTKTTIEKKVPRTARGSGPVGKSWRQLRPVGSAAQFKLRCANFLCGVIPPLALSSLRPHVYRKIGIRIGARVAFLSRIRIIGCGPGVYQRLSIGDGSLIGLYPTFNLDDTITIGRNVSLGPQVSIYTSTHLLGPGSRRMDPRVLTRPVVIEDGAWVGVGAIILPGVVVGRGSVVSAGSVVTEAVPPNSMVAGNPAKLVQELPWADR